ncbi:CBS domain-containing protein [Candidatus Binatia bacterium]|nr:CBS domain-containing protein [Candidatus Binatia bacterium]
MLIERWMTRRVHVVKPRDSIRHAREIMETNRVNQLPVVVDHEVVGIVTDRDLRDAYPSVFDAQPRRPGRSGEPPADPSHIAVETVMTSNVVTLGPQDSVVEAARRMRRERIGAIPVVDNGRLVGIVTRSDILDAFTALVEPAHPDAPAPRDGGKP